MATLGEAVEDAVPSDKSQQQMNPDSRQLDSQSSQEESSHSALPEKELGEFRKRQSPNPEFSAPQCNEEGNTLSIITDKVLDNVQQRQGSDINSGDHTSQSSQEGTPLSAISVSATHNQRQSHDYASGDHLSEASQAGTSLSLMPVKDLDNLQQGQISDTGAHASQSNQEGSSLSTIPEKVPKSVQLTQSINTGSHLLQRDQEGRTPSRIPDKASEDGFNWRKYGQKLVKGNEFIRSYYRCTHPNCPAKRQVERSQDGQITDIIYLGNHEHPKPQPSPHIAVCSVLPIRAKRPEEAFLAVQDDKSSNTEGPTSHNAEPAQTPQLPTIAPSDDAVEGAVSLSNRARDAIKDGGDSNSKRQKKDICNIDESPAEKPHGEPKVVVQTTSEVDMVNDGFRWRKYGQKLVKGNPNPRSYYRCSKSGCPAKKHVERASHDPKVVITTYEGQHGHDRPPARTVTHNTAGANTNITALNGESKSRPEENSAVGLDMAVHISAN